MTDHDVYAAPNPSLARENIAAPAQAGNRALWLGMLAPPVAWLADTLMSITLHHDYCAALLGRTFRPWSGIGLLLAMVGVAMLALSFAGGLLAWRAHVVVGSDTGQGETTLDRRRFMARAGLFTCALFSYAIVLRLLAPLILPPGFCGP